MGLLKGKKILYITYPMFQYISLIREEMLQQDAEVKMYITMEMKLWDSFLLNFSTPLYNKHRESFLARCMNNILLNGDIFTDVFIQFPHLLGEKNMAAIRSHFKSARFILYNWDSISRYETNKYFNYFDKTVTFDPADAKKYNLVYLPLFFTKEFDKVYADKRSNSNKTKEKKYDIVFIGKAADHDERYPWITGIIDYCKKENLTYYVFLYIRLKRYLKYLLKGKILKNVGFKPMSLKQIAEVYRNAIAVVDHPNPNQQGMTMRTFEVLGSGCRLITTNRNILNEPFFDKKYISIFNASPAELNPDEFNEPSARPGNFEQYRIDNWLKKIFE